MVERLRTSVLPPAGQAIDAECVRVAREALSREGRPASGRAAWAGRLPTRRASRTGQVGTRKLHPVLKCRKENLPFRASPSYFQYKSPGQPGKIGQDQKKSAGLADGGWNPVLPLGAVVSRGGDGPDGHRRA